MAVNGRIRSYVTLSSYPVVTNVYAIVWKTSELNYSRGLRVKGRGLISRGALPKLEILFDPNMDVEQVGKKRVNETSMKNGRLWSALGYV